MSRQKFLVISLLQNFFFGEHKDFVRIPDRGEAVGNNEHPAYVSHFLQGILNQKFRFHPVDKMIRIDITTGLLDLLAGNAPSRRRILLRIVPEDRKTS